MIYSEKYLSDLNTKYAKIDVLDRVAEVFKDFKPKDVLVTSSFGATAAVLLDMVQKASPNHPIYTIDTGYLFPETIQYMDELKEKMQLNIKTISAHQKQHLFTEKFKTYEFNPTLCCHINKQVPLERIKSKHKLWLSGLLAFQNSFRKQKNIFEESNGILKCYPLINLSEEMLPAYQLVNNIPKHPLVDQGYDSIGCTYCTAKGKGRLGRWAGLSKTECGLHT